MIAFASYLVDSYWKSSQYFVDRTGLASSFLNVLNFADILVVHNEHQACYILTTVTLYLER